MNQMRIANWRRRKVNKQTEKLGDSVTRILHWYCNGYRDWRLLTEEEKAMWKARAGDILRACREAGLIFRHDCRNCPDREEDAWGLVCVVACGKPFEEIDIED